MEKYNRWKTTYYIEVEDDDESESKLKVMEDKKSKSNLNEWKIIKEMEPKDLKKIIKNVFQGEKNQAKITLKFSRKKDDVKSIELENCKISTKMLSGCKSLPWNDKRLRVIWRKKLGLKIDKCLLEDLKDPAITEISSTYFQKFPLPHLRRIDERRRKYKYCLGFIVVFVLAALLPLAWIWFRAQIKVGIRQSSINSTILIRTSGCDVEFVRSIEMYDDNVDIWNNIYTYNYECNDKTGPEKVCISYVYNKGFSQSLLNWKCKARHR